MHCRKCRRGDSNGPPWRICWCGPKRSRPWWRASRCCGSSHRRRTAFTRWGVKAAGGGNIQLELGDQPPGQPPHHIAAIFSLSNHTVRDGDIVIKDGGIDQGPNGWQKIWLNLVTADGNLDITLRPANGDVLTFKGDGNLGMILGGVEANPHG
jgi:hypothetical protein